MASLECQEPNSGCKTFMAVLLPTEQSYLPCLFVFETGISYVAWGSLEQLISPASTHKCWDYSSVPPCLLFSRKFHHLPPLDIGICKCISSFGNSSPFFFKDLFIYYVYNILPQCMPTRQRRAPDFSTDGCEPPCGCWELNSGPLEEQPVLLTAEPSLQP